MTNKLRNNFWNIRALAAWKNFVRYSDHDPHKDIFKSTCELIIKCKILMIQAILKKFYKANLEIQYKHNVNVIVSDAIYAPKNKEVIDVREPIVEIRVVNDDIPIYAPPSYINVINAREPFEDIRVRGPTEDLRVVNNDILIDEREPSKDSISVINVREPIEDRRVIKKIEKREG